MLILDRTSSQSIYPPCIVRSPFSVKVNPLLPWRTLRLSNTTHSPVKQNLTHKNGLFIKNNYENALSYLRGNT